MFLPGSVISGYKTLILLVQFSILFLSISKAYTHAWNDSSMLNPYFMEELFSLSRISMMNAPSPHEGSRIVLPDKSLSGVYPSKSSMYFTTVFDVKTSPCALPLGLVPYSLSEVIDNAMNVTSK